MPNTNFQTIFQMGQAINDMVKQATGRDVVKEIEMGQVTVAQNHKAVDGTASGTIAEFITLSALPLQIIADINPVQDLHGYDKPWVGGAGKNLCPDDVSEFSVSGEGWFSLSGVEASTWTYGTKVHLKAGAYKRSFSNLDNITTVQTFDSNGNLMTITSGTIVMGSEGDIYIRIKATGNISLKTQIEEGSTVTDWEPYSNICPITGWTGAEITRTGGEMFNSTVTIQRNKGINSTTGAIESADYYDLFGMFDVNSETTYEIKAYSLNVSGGIGAYFYQEDGTYISRIFTPNVNPGSKIVYVTTPANCKKMYVSVARLAAYPVDESQFHLCEYRLYNIAFPDSAGTVYGGTLTINKDGTGTILIAWANIASYDGEELPGVWISDRDVYEEGTTPTTGAQVVYELATPLEPITLEASVIESLIGANYVSANTGNVTVNYTDIIEGGNN